MPQGINVGSIYADLDLNTGNLEQGLARGRAALEGIGQEVKRLQTDFLKGAVGAAELQARMNDLQLTAGELAHRMQLAYGALGVNANALGVFNSQVTAAGRSARGFGMGLMQVSYAFDDLQYGIGAVVNNIGPLVYMTGGSAGLAGALQITAVAANVLYKHLGEIKEAMGDTAPITTATASVKELGEEFKRLQKNTKDGWWSGPTGQDFARLHRAEGELEKAKEGEKGFEKLAGKGLEEDDKPNKRFGDAVAEYKGGKNVGGGARGLARDIADRNASTDPNVLEKYLSPEDLKEYKAKQAAINFSRSRGQKPLPLVTEQMEGLRARALDALRKDTERQLGEAGDNPVRQKLLGEQLTGFGGDLGKLGDVIAGRRKTQHEQREAEKKAGKEWADAIKAEYDDAIKAEKEGQKKLDEQRRREKEGRKEDVETARKIRPGYDKEAEELAAKAIGEGKSREQAVAEMQARLKAPDAKGRFMNPGEAEAAAKDTVGAEFDKLQADPDRLKALNDRRKREAAEAGKKALPGFDKIAEQEAAAALNRGQGREQAVGNMEGRLKMQGLPAEQARAAAEASAGKQFNEMRGDPDRLKAHNKQRRREAIDEAEDRVPALKEQAEDAVMAGMAGGVPMDAVGRQIEAELRRRGMNPGQAGEAAGALTEDVSKSVRDKVAKRAMQGPDPAQVAHSQIFGGGTDYAKAVQGGVTNSATEAKDQRKKMIDYLAQIASQPGFKIKVN